MYLILPSLFKCISNIKRKEGISMESFCTDMEVIHKLNSTYEGNPYEIYPRQMNVLGRRMQELRLQRLKKQTANLKSNYINY